VTRSTTSQMQAWRKGRPGSVCGLASTYCATLVDGTVGLRSRIKPQAHFENPEGAFIV
jgi:hypothetical protein